MSVLTVSPAVCDRAAQIRAQYGFKPLDSLHLYLKAQNDGRESSSEPDY